MSNNRNQKNKGERLTQDQQLRQLFLSLKTLALVIVLLGVCLIVVLSFTNISPMNEIALLIFFGVVSAGFLIARARSILLYFEQVQKK